MSENFLFLDRNSRNGLNYVKSIVVVLHSKGVITGFSQVSPTKVEACKSFIFTENKEQGVDDEKIISKNCRD